MGRTDLEWKVKWGHEVSGQPAKWELKGMKTDKCKEREKWDRKSEKRTGKWMRMWRVKNGLLGRKDWHCLTTSPSGGHHLKLFASTNSFIFMQIMQGKRGGHLRGDVIHSVLPLLWGNSNCSALPRQESENWLYITFADVDCHEVKVIHCSFKSLKIHSSCDPLQACWGL